MQFTRPHFVLLQGGKSTEPEVEGPVTRLGLRYPLGQVTRGQWIWLAATKIILLSSLLYVVCG